MQVKEYVMQEKESFKRIVRLSLSGVCLLGEAAIYIHFLYDYYFEPIKLNLRFFEKGEALFIAISFSPVCMAVCGSDI